MSTEQKIGQIMIWSFAGTTVTAALEEHLTKFQPGALIFFRRNIETYDQIMRLNSRLQSIARQKFKSDLMLMVDQEGGVVTRIRIKTPLPSALALGKVSDPQLIESFARAKGELLSALGFTVNLAPVMDISNPEQDSFIGNRTFGADPAVVSNLAIAYAKGLSAAGIVPTGKHFPGHGGTDSDSHKESPQKAATIEELSTHDFVPFQRLAQEGPTHLVMTAHLALPQVDESGLPATYSSILIQEHLRSKLGFAGVVITDDLEMAGAEQGQDVGERAVKAFMAGNDMLMLAGSSKNQRLAFHAILRAVNGPCSR